MNLRNAIRDLGQKCSIRAYQGDGDLVINWGVSHGAIPGMPLNKPESVAIAVNKLKSLAVFNERMVSTVKWTTDPAVAGSFKLPVIARTKLCGSGGYGIYVLNDRSLLRQEVSALEAKIQMNLKLFTEYKKKSAEYRVHVFCGEVIRFQVKKRKLGARADPMIRCHENGWVFCEENQITSSAEHDSVIHESRLAVDALGLDFGAVDVIWNNHEAKAYVLEVNTAPGLEGGTLAAYAKAIIDWGALRE